MTRDNATSRLRAKAGCMGSVSASAETAAASAPTAGRAESPAAAWSLAAMGGLTYGTIEAGAARITTPRVLAAFAAAAAALAVFGLLQARGRHPMLPLSLFRSRTVSAATVIGFAFMVGYYGLPYAVPARRAGVASGVFNTSRQVGGALAVAVFGALLASQATFLPGLRVSLLIAACVALAAAAVSVLIRPSAEPTERTQHD